MGDLVRALDALTAETVTDAAVLAAISGPLDLPSTSNAAAIMNQVRCSHGGRDWVWSTACCWVRRCL
jgi:hypothetical protein